MVTHFFGVFIRLYLISGFLGMGVISQICQAMLCLYMSIANGVSWEQVIIPLNAVSCLNDAWIGVGRREATHINGRARGDAKPLSKPFIKEGTHDSRSFLFNLQAEAPLGVEINYRRHWTQAVTKNACPKYAMPHTQRNFGAACLATDVFPRLGAAIQTSCSSSATTATSQWQMFDVCIHCSGEPCSDGIPPGMFAALKGLKISKCLPLVTISCQFASEGQPSGCVDATWPAALAEVSVVWDFMFLFYIAFATLAVPRLARSPLTSKPWKAPLEFSWAKKKGRFRKILWSFFWLFPLS